MKSLEIVDESDFKNSLDLVECTIKSMQNMRYVEMTREELETIKQDLEVLEIIKNKEVFIGELKYAYKNKRNDREVLHFYNFGKHPKLMLTMEELIKLKQWLEVNE